MLDGTSGSFVAGGVIRVLAIHDTSRFVQERRKRLVQKWFARLPVGTPVAAYPRAN
jgi:hypothetical protein